MAAGAVKEEGGPGGESIGIQNPRRELAPVFAFSPQRTEEVEEALGVEACKEVGTQMGMKRVAEVEEEEEMR